MFINDLDDGVQSTVLKFADDTKLYTEVTKEEGGEQLQEDLDKCTEWAKQWMMEFNVAKCKVLHAGRTNRMKEYTMEGKILKKVQEEKDLGVMVHKAMNGSRHQPTRHDDREQLVRVAKEADRTVVRHVVTGALLVQHDECPTHQFGRDTLRVPHHSAYSEEFIPSVNGPSVGFYGHVVTPSRFATT